MAPLESLHSDTDSLFDEVDSPQRHVPLRTSQNPARETHPKDLRNETSLLVDWDGFEFPKSPSVIFDPRRSWSCGSEDKVFEDAVPTPVGVNGEQHSRPRGPDAGHVEYLSELKTIKDSEGDRDSAYDLSDIPAELPDAPTGPATHDGSAVNQIANEDNRDGALGAFATEDDLERLTQSSVSVELPESALLVPRSHYEPFNAGAPESSERAAVKALMGELETCSDYSEQDFLELQLNDFAVYNKTTYYGVEMRALTDMEIKFHGSRFVFDGILSAVNGKSFFVRGVPIQALPIGNYSTLDEHTVRDEIWILSPFNSGRGLYYKLGRPAKEYRRFHESFLWVADLAKHFVDFIKAKWDEGYRVSIHDFRADFKRWLSTVHEGAPDFRDWLSRYPREDFRSAVIANLPFLHKEAVGVLGEKQVYVHTIWKEAWMFTQYLPATSTKLSNPSIPPTVVTSYVKECFGKLPFAEWLEAVDLSPETAEMRNQTIHKRHLELPHAVDTGTAELSTTSNERIKNIRPGDTLSTRRDIDGHWERQEAHGFTDLDRWFVLVQDVHVDRKGRRTFDVIWYYRPVDTLCGSMSYPWANELFLSDHCNCEETTKIDEDEVLGVHDVDFHGTGTTTKELFCRQTYLSEERKWVTLEDKHRKCAHRQHDVETEHAQYSPGETVLAHLDRKTMLSEPCVVVSSFQQEGRAVRTYKLRRFLRRRSFNPASGASPNELVYTGDIVTVNEKVIKDRCFVRQFRPTEAIPSPYNRDGTGSFFFVTHEKIMDWSGAGRVVPLKALVTFKQGYDPSEEIPRLRGLDLFCGGGNLGRGLEDGGGIRMKWANDYVDKAIHTYMANVDDPNEVHPFLDSIDIMQRLAIEGKFSESVPKPGEVDFISGGSPCPGFSRLTNDKTTDQQRKNQSLVAAFASMVDLYRPKYGLLENVPGIVQKKTNKDQDVFSQLICAIVGLGYQTSFYLMDANSCGAPQKRSRVFLVFAAPGCELPPKPKETHSQPPGAYSQTLGHLPNGLPMAERVIPEATPFKHVTAAEATADLPRIIDGKPDICIPFPDHRVTIGQTKKIRRECAYVPTRPWGMNFAKAWFGESLKGKPGSGVMTPSEREFYPPDKPNTKDGKEVVSRVARNSQAYGRLDPNIFIRTITTRLSANDAKEGRCFHWSENRVMTLMEARRAQGFRDEDVLLGTPNDQYKIVGNSVAREIALALGAAFREAWVATLEKRKKQGASVLTNGDVERDVAQSQRQDESIFANSADSDTDDENVQVIPRRRMLSNFASAKTRHSSGFDKNVTVLSSCDKLVNRNGKRRASSSIEDDRICKTQRRSSTSLTLTKESSYSGNSRTTKTTMTVTTVNEVGQPSRGLTSMQEREIIVISDDDDD